MMVIDPEKIIAMPDEVRANLKLAPTRRKYSKVKRDLRTPDELIDYLRDKGFRSWRALEKGRTDNDPKLYDYIRAFGKWSEAIEVAFGKGNEEPWEREPPNDPEYMVKVVVQFKLWTYRRYLKFRRANPSIAPSIRQVKKKWGRYSNLKETAAAVSIHEMIRRYLILSRRLGHKPSITEARKNGVEIGEVVKRSGGWRMFKQLVSQLEAVDAK